MTHKQKILNILKDGRWHSAKELHDKVGWRFGARLYDLRQEGFSFEKDTSNKLDMWRLKSYPAEKVPIFNEEDSTVRFAYE